MTLHLTHDGLIELRDHLINQIMGHGLIQADGLITGLLDIQVQNHTKKTICKLSLIEKEEKYRIMTQ